MKIRNISNKTIDFFKRNGKRFVCLVVTGYVLLVPSKAKLEEHNNSVTNNLKYVEEIPNEEMVFTITTEWMKTNNYSDGNGPAKENREYKRTIRRIVIDENFNEDFFKDDYRKLLSVVEDYYRSGYPRLSKIERDYDYENIFKVIEEMDEIIVVDRNEENKLDKTNWTLEVEGTDIKEKMMNPALIFGIKNTAIEIAFYAVPLSLACLPLLIPKLKSKAKRFKKIMSKSY